MKTPSHPRPFYRMKKILNGYKSDIEVELGMTRATREASERESEKTDGESRFLRSGAWRPITITERAVQLKLARKIHGKRRLKKNLEGLYKFLANAPIFRK